MSGLTIVQLSLVVVPLFLSVNLAKNYLLANLGCANKAHLALIRIFAPLVKPDSIQLELPTTLFSVP
jgi:hypothetical protein